MHVVHDKLLGGIMNFEITYCNCMIAGQMLDRTFAYVNSHMNVLFLVCKAITPLVLVMAIYPALKSNALMLATWLFFWHPK